MDLKESVIYASTMSIGYAQLLVKDLSEEQMTTQPVPGITMNHATWVIGHLARVCQVVTGRLTGKEPNVPAGWDELFGIKSVVQPAGRYPSKAELVKALEEGHAAMVAAFRAAPDSKLDEPMPDPISKRFPTLRQFVVFLLTNHQSLHLGQLSAWRRAQGLPPVL